MGTIWLREFTGGLDARRMPETTAGGALIYGVDGHITRGGDFEQRAAIVKYADLPAGATKGLAATVDSLYVFGHASAPTMPSGVLYQQLPPPSGETLQEVLSATLFQGKLFVGARFSDDLAHDYFDGVKVTDWPVGAPFATFVATVQQKVYGVAGPTLHFSAIADAPKFASGTGYGFIDMSTQASGAERLVALAQYQNYIAVFAERSIQIEYVDPDPALNRWVQTLNNTGTIAPRSVTQFGDNDVFYLDESGVRSLRARSAINVAFSSDTGSPIDDLIVERLTAMTAVERAKAIGLIEPQYGRLWIILKDEIFVFSFFTATKVSAWTIYRPGFVVDDAVVFDRKVYLRSGDTVYVYGGSGDTPVYEGVEAEAWTPYLDANAPTRKKNYTGVDVAAQGVWEVRVALEPTDLDASDKVATIDRTTYNLGRLGGLGSSTHVSLRFKSKGPTADGKPAKIASAVIHHDMDEDED